MDAMDLLHAFQTTDAMQKDCQEIYCSTCGGKSAAILRNRRKYVQSISEALSNASVDDLVCLGPWLSVALEIEPAVVRAALINAANSSESYDVRTLDKFILLSGRFKDISPDFRQAYAASLTRAREVAMQTRDISLMETLVISMGSEMLNYPELLALVLANKDEPHLARALYNRLREHVPEVRSYMDSGAGT